MISDSVRQSGSIRATFLKAEERGLKVAIRGKLFAIGLMLLYLITSRGFAVAPAFLLAGGLFAALGVLHYRIIGSPIDQPWIKYAFLSLDILLLSILIAIGPTDLSYDLPKTLIFRFDIFIYYFLFIALAGFSFSPGLMLWAGIAGSLGWTGAYLYVLGGVDSPLQWSDIPIDATSDQFLSVFLSPDFLPYGSRMQEALVLIITAALLSVVMHRARKTVYAHLEADAERRSVSDLFGRHVPRVVADLIINARGALEPTEREATVLFADIVGFTALTERLGPSGITNVLNAYFDDAANIITSQGGIITQFQGDAILAVFNLPVADPDHAWSALRAGIGLLERVNDSTYGEEKIAIRIGINTGNVVAGNVGGGGRENYTVHGDAVNMAARLEALNKDLGTHLLVSASTAKQTANASLERVGTVEVRGQSKASEIFAYQHSGKMGT